VRIEETDLPGLYIVHNKAFYDERGAFVKTFNEETFKHLGLVSEFRESFYSVSKKGVIRGMHFQLPPAAHVKLVYVIHGKIVDVVADIRKNSPTYGQYKAIELSSDAPCSLYIPIGFAHGFETISEDAIVVYMTTTVHNPKYDSGIRWDSFGYKWSTKMPIISRRDQKHPTLAEFESPFSYGGQ